MIYEGTRASSTALMAEEHGRSNGEHRSTERWMNVPGTVRIGGGENLVKVQVDAAAGRRLKILRSSVAFLSSSSNGVLAGQEAEGGRRREKEE